MKKQLNIGIMYSILFMSISLFSCKKYLDIKTSNTQIFIRTIDDCRLLLDDYGDLNTGYPSDGEASADNYYLNNAGYLLTSLSPTDRDLYIWSASAIRPSASPQWQAPYKIVYLANLVMEYLDKFKASTDQATYNGMRGEALFFRSYSFWQVAQLYASPYSSTTSGQDPGIPLRLSADINGKSDRGTVGQTYNRIVQDLQEAVSLLPKTSIVASRPNKSAAYAMLARVYLSMEDYTNALVNSSAALQLNNQLMDYNTLSKTAATPFTRFNKEVYFHAIMSADPGLNPAGATNNVAKVDSDLYNSFDVNDLRKQIYFKVNSGSNIGTYRFSGNYEPTTNSNFFEGLAVDELYLIRAECYARSGDVSSAMTDLNTLLKTRWSTNTYVDMTAANADAALLIILKERRKELIFRGLRWTDLRRLNKDSRFAITLSRTVNGNTYTLPPNDKRYTLLIPTEVITNSSIPQNAR